MRDLFVYGAVVVSTTLYILLAKLYTLTDNPSTRAVYVASAAALFFLLFFSYTRIFLITPMCTSYTLTKMASIALVAVAGFVFFGETMDMKQMVGLGLAFVAICMLT